MGGRIVGSLPVTHWPPLADPREPRQTRTLKLPTKQESMTTLTALIETGDHTPVVAQDVRPRRGC